MLDLVARLEAATGPDRQLDLDIRLGLFLDAELAETVKHRQGFDNKPGLAWELGRGAVLYQKRDEHGRCFYNGGHPIPAYTSSIDAALTLVPDPTVGWWSVEQLCSPDSPMRNFGASGAGMFKVTVAHWRGKEYRARSDSAALALCIAALKARHAISVTSNVRPGESAGDGV